MADNLFRGKLPNQGKLSLFNFDNGAGINNVYVGIVVSIDDPLNAGRIKVRIPNLDINKEIFCKERKKNGGNVRPVYKVQGNEKNQIYDTEQLNTINEISNKDVSNNTSDCIEIPWSTPFLPKHFQSLPKVDEIVKVVIYDVTKPNLNREWVGPIISLRNKISFDGYNTAGSTMNTALIFATSDPTDRINLKKRGGFTGGFPEPLDIAIQSRNNADIVLPTFQTNNGNILKGGEVLIRAGKLLADTDGVNLKLNDINPAYFRLKVLDKTLNSAKNTPVNPNVAPETHAMLFSDFISIISHKNGEQGSDKIKKINPIIETDDEIKNLQTNLQPLIRGNFLIEFLELLRDYVANHNHPYAGLPATNANSKPDILKFDLNKLLSTNIRIN
jgi:hypothetical protein